jgi:hypothetical protein
MAITASITMETLTKKKYKNAYTIAQASPKIQSEANKEGSEKVNSNSDKIRLHTARLIMKLFVTVRSDLKYINRNMTRLFSRSPPMVMMVV